MRNCSHFGVKLPMVEGLDDTRMIKLIVLTLLVVIHEAAIANAQQKTTTIIEPSYNGNHVVELGQEFRLVCEGKSKSEKLLWQKLSASPETKIQLKHATDGFMITEDSTGKNMKSILTKTHMTTSDEASYTCYPDGGSDANGDAKAVQYIEIAANQTVFVMGAQAIMTCEVNGITTYTRPIEWRKLGEKDDKPLVADNKRIFINGTQYGSLLQVNDASSDDFTNYTCVVYVHNKTLSFEQTVPVFLAPHVKDFAKSKNLVQGDTLRLNCEVQGSSPVAVTWYKDNALFSHKEAQYKDSVKGVVNASLTLEHLDFGDRGEYTCSATSLYGSHNATVLVRVKDKLAALWPFLGICAEVAILCTIIFIYERRRAKKIEEEEAKEEAGHLTNSHDHKGQDVRQRK